MTQEQVSRQEPEQPTPGLKGRPVDSPGKDRATLTASSAGLIYLKIAAVMRDIDAIGKGRRNEQQKYSFRGIDDVYNELHEHLGKHGVFTVPTVLEERTEEKTTKSGTVLIYRVLKVGYQFFAEDGSNVRAVVIGEGMDSGDKASNKAMAVAHKYALMQVFAIPTEESKDPENESHELKAPGKPKAQKLDIDPTAIYDGSDTLKQALCAIAKKSGIPNNKWSLVHERAKGRPFGEVQGIVNKVKEELSSVAQ